MKSRIPPSTMINKHQQKAIKQFAAEEFQKQAQDHIRRVLKLVCVSLNEEFGFGKERLSRLVDRVNTLSIERESDPVFWSHVDTVMKQLGINFKPEDYDDMDN